ncbi:MAG: sigma-54-dependent Fis family transcriptional regulator [Desulfobacterales bacterium CG07_land_8_20_14_0_80_52_14]|nr:MAG: sigma-54-dependent Fis family transcriptional regulator [Desulfobacterales bacterium CG23_combo_of_CG06-09_8_20_14_all_52_9]PIU50480.1 MAG: sigma-54-dependent Fis family transcriptional regulator [Desulfobacterales bacterium CG07_land_8_20_14_0_80_52_14]
MKIHKTMRVLVVDNCRESLNLITSTLEASGFQFTAVTSVAEAIRVLEFTRVDLVISETMVHDMKGLDFIRYMRDNFSDLEILTTTFNPCIDDAIRVIKEGANDYLIKPLNVDQLLSAVMRMKSKLIRRRQIQEETSRKSYGIIGESAGITGVIDNIEKAASYNANVLIRGESGTGKELVARAIHYASERAASPFVPVNCTAIPESLLESELFGHVRGAFTGARDGRAGFFQIAEGGTLFLDEIGDASPAMQGKLLRVIENKEIQIVGSSRVQKINTRIITATNKDLIFMVQKGLFREDLYYRLVVIDIVVPPLRERKEDILTLAHHFMNKFIKELRRDPPRFTDGALEALKNYRWPGNVRELENLIQRLLVIVGRPVIDVADLPSYMRFQMEHRVDPMRTLADMEAEHIRSVLQLTGGNKTRAANILGIDRKTLREKLKKYCIPDKESGN